MVRISVALRGRKEISLSIGRKVSRKCDECAWNIAGWRKVGEGLVGGHVEARFTYLLSSVDENISFKEVANLCQFLRVG